MAKISALTEISSVATNDVMPIVDVSATTTKKMTISKLLNMIYPVGSIYMSVDSTNPTSYFGGTWVAWGSGRVPVGVDTNQTEFNTVEETGGSKNLQEHSHVVSAGAAGGDYGGVSSGYYQGRAVFSGINSSTSSVGTGDSGNLQPYITCYMWKRTA